MSSPGAAAESQPSNVDAPNNDAQVGAEEQRSSVDGKEKKRRFFGLGKRKDGDKSPGTTTPTQDPASAPSPGLSTAPSDIPRAPRSPPQAHSLSAAASPARSARLRSSSPRLEPDSSSIFERNVQDSTLPDEIAKDLAIPAHIQTEDHIPPALEASTIAITDDHLGPDEVKIVTHTAHQPAAEKVVGAAGTHTPGASDVGLSPIGGLSPIEDPGINIHQSLESSQSLGSAFQPYQGGPGAATAAAGPADDSASSYAAGAGADDVRRLSFISFADVVQSEHQHADPSMSVHSLGSTAAAAAAANRSPSPVLRSPVSSQGPGGSPPASGSASAYGLDASRSIAPHQQQQQQQQPPGSPGRATGRETGGEIVVETMRQALRRTGSGDLRNTAGSPVDGELPLR